MTTEITREQLGLICFWFHKLARTTDLTNDSRLWIAIKELERNNYEKLMECALEEAGIKVNQNVRS